MSTWEQQMEDDKSSVKWKVSPHVRATHSPDGCVLLDIEKGLCYSLNGVGARVWLAIEASQAGITLEDVVRALETNFKVLHQELATDTAEYLDKLGRIGLVQRNGHCKLSKALGGGS